MYHAFFGCLMENQTKPMVTMSLQQATTELKQKLLRLRDEVNAAGLGPVEFHQQAKTKKHMSFTVGNRRVGCVYVSPADVLGDEKSYDIAPYGISGIALEVNMRPFMETLCGRECGFKHPPTRQPYWRTRDFNLVRKAVYYYAEIVKAVYDGRDFKNDGFPRPSQRCRS